MAPPIDQLVKIGLEGFDLIDKVCGPRPPRRSSGGVPYPRQGRWGFQAFNGKNEEEAVIINSKDAARRYHGVVVVSYPNTKPAQKWVAHVK